MMYLGSTMYPDQTAPLGAVGSGFIVLASMIEVVSSACDRRNKQTIFSAKYIGRIRAKMLNLQNGL